MATCSYESSTQTLRCSGECVLNQQTDQQFIEAKNLKIEEGITVLNHSALKICKNLINIEFGPTLTTIWDDVFYGNPFTSLHLTKNIVTLSANIPWDNNNELENITIDPENPKYVSKDNVMYTKDMKRIYYVPPKKNISVFIVPHSVEIINNFAFAKATSIEHIILPPLLNTVGVTPYPSSIKSITFLQYKEHELIRTGISENVDVNTMIIPFYQTILRKDSHYKIFVFILIL